MQNLEQKFPCPNLGATERLASQLGAVDRGVIKQHDLFFPSHFARLKVRLFPDDPSAPAQLISYRRPDVPTARNSEYFVTPILDPDTLIAVLTHALGQPRHLKKSRHLYLFKATRIHLDTIEDLGTFAEIETVITTQPLEEAQRELTSVVHALDLADPIPYAYVDLLPP